MDLSGAAGILLEDPCSDPGAVVPQAQGPMKADAQLKPGLVQISCLLSGVRVLTR